MTTTIKSKIIKTLIQLLKKLNTNTIFIETKKKHDNTKINR